jgi:transposase-like protein
MLQLGDLYRVHEATICSVLQRLGVAARDRKILTPEDEAVACKQYVAGSSLSQLAGAHGCSSTTIWRMLKRHGVERRAAGARR